MGDIADIDRAIRKYISKYEMQLEYAIKEIGSIDDMESCLDENPYTAHVLKAEKFIKDFVHNKESWTELLEETAIEIIEDAYEFFERRGLYFKELEFKKAAIEKCINDLEAFKSLDADMPSLRDLKFILFNFGRMPVVNFKQFEIYINDQEDIIFQESKRDKNYVYGVYFVLSHRKDKIDAAMSSLNFEKITIPFEYEGQIFPDTPLKAYNMLLKELEEIEKEISFRHNETMYTFGINANDVTNAYKTLKKNQIYYDLRKYAAKTPNGYYIFAGWAAKPEALRLEYDMEHDDKVIFLKEPPENAKSSTPPTSLKNNALIRPFEFFVKTYGLPKYDEIDPTPFVAVTYFLLFGMMFGDLGQGALLCLGGYFLYKYKGLGLGKILSLVGISSMFFGLMYGSVFGIEHILPTIWLKPAESVNSILFITLVCGMVLIFISMILNMANAIKQNDKMRLFFGPNGIAGIVFYAGIIMALYDFIYGSGRFGSFLIVPFVIMPFVLIALRHPIEGYLKDRKLHISSGMPLFILETVIEAFEILLTYFTNTVSFVRIGAFALSHAGMMGVVLLLAERGSGYSIPIMVIGNLLVIFMEGLVVGIQALRIEFYELFSRYYEGGGREFISVKAKLDEGSA